jgi:hypothetical protein
MQNTASNSSAQRLNSISRPFVYFTIWGGFLGLALVLFDLVVISLFLFQHKIEMIPLVFLIAGFLGFFLAFAISFLQNYVAIGRLAGGFFFILSILGLWSWSLLAQHSSSDPIFRTVIFWAFVALYPINSKCFYLFEGVFNRLFDLRTAKRYTNRATLGLMLVSAVGLFCVPLFITSSKTVIVFLQNLYGLGAIVMMVSCIFLIVMGFIFPQLNHIPIDLKEVRAKNNFFQLIEQPYVVSLALFLGLAVILSLCIDYFFWYIIVGRYDIKTAVPAEVLPNLVSLVGFLSTFIAVTLLSTLIVKIVFLPNLIRNYGLRMGLLVLPIASGIFLVLAWATSIIQAVSSVKFGAGSENSNILIFLFIFLCLTKLVKDISNSAFKMPVFRRYLLPLDLDLRYDIQAKLEGNVRHVALWATGLLLMAYDTFKLDKHQYLVGIILLSLFIIVGLILVIMSLHREYRQILEKKLDTQSESKGTHTEPKSLARQILRDIYKVSSNQLPVYLNVLNILNPVLYRRAILNLLDDRNGNIQNFINSFTEKIKSKLSEYSDQDLQTLMGENHPTADSFQVKLALDEEVRQLISRLDTQILANRETEHLRNQGQALKEDFNQILKRWHDNLRQLAINIEEDAQKIVLHQAAKLCILEAIPVLDVLIKSRYFPILENARLIQQTYSRLRGAEFRLERIKYIRQLTLSKQTEERIFGALLTIYASQEAQEELLPNLLQDPSYQVRYQALVASSSTTQTSFYYKIIEKLGEPQYGNAAFSALVAIGEPIFPQLENVFYMTGQSQIIQLRIVQVYGRLGTEKAVALLLSKLNDANQNISHQALEMLSRCGRKMSEENASFINAELRAVCENLVWNLAIFITLEKYGLGTVLQEALEAEIEANYNEVFSLMALLYEPESILSVRKNLDSGEAEKGEFARELLNIVLADTVKPVLLPLLDVSTSYSEKIQELQDEYPMEAVTKLNHPEALINIIQRDYKSTNRWTKACALAELAELADFHDATIFVANMVNPNTLISEIAYQFLYEQDPASFKENLDFLCHKENYPSVVKLAKTMQYLKDPKASREARTRFEMVKFFRGVRNFKGVPGLILSEIAELIEWKHLKSGEQIARYDLLEEMDYLIVYKGQVNISSEGIILQIYKDKDFVHDLFYINEVIPNVSINADTESIVFKIDRAKFHSLISVYDEIPMAMLKYTNLQYDLVNSLYKDKLLPVADTLALNSIMQIAEGYEAKSGEVLANYPFIEQMDVWLVQEGMIQLKSNQKTFKLNQGTLSQASLGNEALSNLEIKSLVESRVFKFPEGQLNQISQDLSEVQFFRRVHGIQDLAGFTLLEIALKAELKAFIEGDKLISYTDIKEMDAWMVFSGSLRLRLIQEDNTEQEVIFAERTLIHPWRFLDNSVKKIHIEANKDSKVYLMQKEDFSELLNRFDQLALGLLKVQYMDTYFPITSFLRQLPILNHLSVIDLLELSRAIQIKYYLPGDRIALYSEAEDCDFYIIYTGTIRIQRGKKQYFDKTEKEIIYASTLPADMPNQIRLIAQSNITVYLIRKNELLPFLNNPTWQSILNIKKDEPISVLSDES